MASEWPSSSKAARAAGQLLAQRAAQRVELALAGPDQVLVTTRQDLDRLRQLAVGHDRPVAVAIGSDQVGEGPGVTAIGLGAARRVPLAVAG